MLTVSTFAQHSEHDSHQETEHEHKSHEVGVSLAPVYFLVKKN